MKDTKLAPSSRRSDPDPALAARDASRTERGSPTTHETGAKVVLKTLLLFLVLPAVLCWLLKFLPF